MKDSLTSVRAWLIGVLAMILVMVAVGGITRLTESGLSMVTWEPILGVLPPLNDADWQFRFDQYRAFPEYQKLRTEMTLGEFKSIFFWEYLHRLLGRMLGIVYALPLFLFWRKGALDTCLKRRLLFGLLLGGGQGILGWYMVKSGLSDNPYVSHYRLAAHLGMAFLLFAYLLWVVVSITPEPDAAPASPRARAWAVGLLCLLLVQITWGAFVAGLNAGFFYNTFPTMQGSWTPPYWNQLQPVWKNLFDNPATVQFIHRTLGVLLGLLGLSAWFQLRQDPTIEGRKRFALHLFTILLVIQFWLGVFTLILIVPVALATIHQVTACLLFGSACLMLATFFQTGRPTALREKAS